MSALPPIRGHEDVRASLARAALAGELPGSLLLHGPPGVGKQRLGLWLAQLLACERPGGEPCGACVACRLALRLEHPDILWFFPIARPKASGGPDRLAEAMEEARAEELAARRENPWRRAAPGEPLGLFLPQIQTLRRYAATRPAMARRKVFLIGDAELLVPQESSPEAANALLKVLEEPPADTTFILTASDAESLLPTIRSRLLPVRLRPLPDEEVARCLVEERGTPPREAERIARLAQGAIGRALGFLPDDGEPGPLEALRQQALELLEAASAAPAMRRLAAALAVGPAGGRGAFTDLLEALSLWLRDLAATAAGAPEQVVNTDAADRLAALASRLPGADLAAANGIRLVEEARALAYGNVNPQLILAWLLRSLHATLSPTPPGR
ncbi:MAG: hypothetical protein IRZ00_05725 [Gemmatimonadetes bacterium]|nr:hypothetical protein [Gemmatimonadota bacterium]